MRQGDSGQPVRELQAALNRAGYGPTRVDGVFGPATENLVREAQHVLGLTVDGIVGPVTSKALGIVDTRTAQTSRWHRAVNAANNQYGDVIAKHAGPVGVAAALAIIAVESAGRGLTTGRPTIRFEVHLFERLVGEKTSQMMFRHDEAKPWNGHQMRKVKDWRDIHTGKQTDEYVALERAEVLNPNAAYKSISMGAPQILGSWFERLGYLTPMAMWRGFHVEEEQIRALFKFLETGDDAHRNPDGDLWASAVELRWLDFARQYNGPGQAATYETWLRAAYEAAERLLA